MAISAKQLIELYSLMNKIINGVGDNSLDIRAVKRVLQDIAEGRLPADRTRPFWWRTPEQQMERAHKLWPGIELPEPPKNFTPKSPTGVLLLHVPQPLDVLWSAISVPRSFSIAKWDDVKISEQHLRLMTYSLYYTRPTWIEFDPEYGKGVNPDRFWAQSSVNIAATEALSALIQFPEWLWEWFNIASAPILSGFRVEVNGRLSHAPYIGIDDNRMVTLGIHNIAQVSYLWASASTRLVS